MLGNNYKAREFVENLHAEEFPDCQCTLIEEDNENRKQGIRTYISDLNPKPHAVGEPYEPEKAHHGYMITFINNRFIQFKELKPGDAVYVDDGKGKLSDLNSI